MIRMIVSGGQTGVDRAALDAAIARGIPTGGWCPKGRLAEDGTIPQRYTLRETETTDYAERTKRNVRDSDATLIVCRRSVTGGTLLTRDTAVDLDRPVYTWDLGDADGLARAEAWLASVRPRILNVAGPRESGEPGIHAEALEALTSLLLSTPTLRIS